ncbi:MAG: hypothetical protein JW866_04100 [Ignavibacteriales bacterium]|nr:hypothetical protein [Ignavibacteriales bacterium]
MFINKIIVENYDANRSQETYNPIIISSFGGYFPNYPADVLENMNTELAKIAIIQKIRFINLKFKNILIIWEEINEGKNDIIKASKYNVLDGPNYDELVFKPTIMHTYIFEVENLIFIIRLYFEAEK